MTNLISRFRGKKSDMNTIFDVVVRYVRTKMEEESSDVTMVTSKVVARRIEDGFIEVPDGIKNLEPRHIKQLITVSLVALGGDWKAKNKRSGCIVKKMTMESRIKAIKKSRMSCKNIPNFIVMERPEGTPDPVPSQ